jgi:t-SNARE complex subunit (syntaxin)
MSYGATELQQVKRDLDETVEVMRNNMEKVIDRGDNINQIEDKSEALERGASQFNAASQRLKRKMFWQDKKVLLIIIFVVIVILLIIILPAILTR